jgi:SAM-dependent methyltransferase
MGTYARMVKYVKYHVLMEYGVDHMNKEEQEKEFWDNYSQDFDSIYTHKKSNLSNLVDRIFRSDMYERFEFTLKRSKPIADRSVLDVGCGPGFYSLAYARQGAKRVVGIDYSEKMIQLANERLDKEDLKSNCQFLVNDIMDFKADSKFDISIAMGLFDYTKDPLPILNRMRDLTHEKMILSFPRSFTWRAPVRKVRLHLKGLDVFFYSKKKLKEILESAGIRKYDIVKIGKLHCVVASLGK